MDFVQNDLTDTDICTNNLHSVDKEVNRQFSLEVLRVAFFELVAELSLIVRLAICGSLFGIAWLFGGLAQKGEEATGARDWRIPCGLVLLRSGDCVVGV